MFWNFKDLNKTQGELHLYGEFSEKDFSWLDGGQYVVPKKFLEDAEAIKNKSEILVKINSMGGDLSVGLAIHNWLKDISAKKICIIEGFCCSAATLPAMACDERRIYNNAMFMIHEVKAGITDFVGLNDLAKIQGSLEAAQKCILNTYIEATGLDEEKLKKMINNETYLVGQQAVQEGFCDSVINENQEAGLTNNGFFIVNSVAHSMEKFNISNEIQQKMLNFFNTQNKQNSNFSTTASKENNNQKGVNFVDINDFKEHNGVLYNQIVNQAKKEERERFKGIEEIADKISNDLVNKAKFDELLTAEQLVVKAFKEDSLYSRAFLENLQRDNDQSGVNNVVGGNVDEGQKVNKINNLINFLNKDKRRL